MKHEESIRAEALKASIAFHATTGGASEENVILATAHRFAHYIHSGSGGSAPPRQGAPARQPSTASAAASAYQARQEAAGRAQAMAEEASDIAWRKPEGGVARIDALKEEAERDGLMGVTVTIHGKSGALSECLTYYRTDAAASPASAAASAPTAAPPMSPPSRDSSARHDLGL